ncbi:MAG: type V CRISPR-associated endonuclease Cas1 [Anaerovoracaceae bacterium]|jgi:CRISPR-associated protein Cas1
MLSLPEIKKKQIVFVFAYEGDKLSFSNDNIVVKDKEGKVKHQSTCYKLFMVVIAGDITITSGILKRAKNFGFTICLMNRNLKVYQMINSVGEGNTLLRKYQYSYDKLDLGKRITENKIYNQLSALKKMRKKSLFDKEAISYLNNYIEKVNSANSINEMMGYEGAAAKIYFERIFDNGDWKGRKPRIKCDYINTTLDIGYNILFNCMEALLHAFGFDTYYGVLHRCYYRRKSLVCDFVEPFRPLIDLEVRKGINLGQIKSEDFTLRGHRYVLDWKNSPKYVSLFAKAILAHKEDMFLYVQTYYRSFMKQLGSSEFPFYRM